MGDVSKSYELLDCKIKHDCPEVQLAAQRYYCLCLIATASAISSMGRTNHDNMSIVNVTRRVLRPAFMIGDIAFFLRQRNIRDVVSCVSYQPRPETAHFHGCRKDISDTTSQKFLSVSEVRDFQQRRKSCPVLSCGVVDLDEPGGSCTGIQCYSNLEVLQAQTLCLSHQ